MKQENRSEIIHEALNMLDDEMIEEVEKLRGEVVLDKAAKPTIEHKKENMYDVDASNSEAQKEFRPWRKWGALAASVCVLILAGGIWNAGIKEPIFQMGDGNIAMEDGGIGEDKFQGEAEKQEDISDDMNADGMITDDVAEGENIQDEDQNMGNSMKPENGATVTIPALEILLRQEDGVEADMLGFFIYQGRCYVQTCDYVTKDVVGDYVCSSTGFIDEWTREDGYVELAGSIEAKFYDVKGINPEFMLCTIHDDGTVETYIHNNGITLDKGSELLVDRLNLDENYIAEEHRAVFDRFIASFNEGDFIYTRSIGWNTVYDADAEYHLYITTEEGVPLHFMMLGDGYVAFHGLNQVCLKVDEEVYNEIIDVLEDR